MYLWSISAWFAQTLGPLPEDLPLLPHLGTVDEDPFESLPYLQLLPQLSTLVLVLQAHRSLHPSKLWQVCGFTDEHPCYMKTGKAQAHKRVPFPT